MIKCEMLETDVDDDYFTPNNSTSLANIFGNTSPNDVAIDNPTLKYSPPKQRDLSAPLGETRPTQCIFACALFGYEWANEEYTAKGKLGFAILKINKTGQHNIVLYDSNKSTLSHTIISTDLEFTVKGDVYISFYDNLRKYWSLYATQNEVKSIVDVLKSLNVAIKYSCINNKGPPAPNELENKVDQSEHKPTQEDKESDTDSSVSKRTKASILTRMANVGHSILPPYTASAEKTSDSSDTNESNNQPKMRHKAIKSIPKRHVTDRLTDTQHSQNVIESFQRVIPKIERSMDNVGHHTFNKGHQLVPLTCSNIVSHVDNTSEMNFFMSEQRISNSELRINMNRISDKMDQVLDKIKDIDNADKGSKTNFQNDILQKLLSEYESKIKMYEQLLKAKSIDVDSVRSAEMFSDTKIDKEDVEVFKNKITELEMKSKDKEDEILKLKNKLDIIQKQHAEIIEKKSATNQSLLEDVNNLKHNLEIKNEELANIRTKHQMSSSMNDTVISDKLKSIMNDTFQAISENFDNEENYSGENVKYIIANVIKKVTLQSINK